MESTESAEIKHYWSHKRYAISPPRTWVEMVKNTIRSRDLIWHLFVRDFIMSHKRSFIGISWVIFAPLVGIVSWVFLRQAGLLQPGDLDIPYPVYVLIGTSIWGLYMDFYHGASNTLTAGSSFVSQINYHHEALLVEKALLQLANFAIVFALNIVVMLIFGVVPPWTIIFFPLLLIPLFLLGSAVGLFSSLLSVVGVDFKNILDILMGLTLWITPVIYSHKFDSEIIQTLIPWNPLTYLISSARDIIIYGRLYEPTGYFISCGLALALFLFSARFFYISENRIVEKII